MQTKRIVGYYPKTAAIRPTEEQINQLVVKARAGDQDAWKSLFKITRQRIFVLCLRMWKGNVADAEDSTQDTYLLTFSKLHTFKMESQFQSWVYRIAINAVLMKLRRKQLDTIPLSNLDIPENGTAAVIGERDHYVETIIFRRFAWDLVRQLPAGYRQALVLHDFVGYEHNEIANILGFSIGNSKSQLHKARLRMLELIAESRGMKLVRGDRTSSELIKMLKPFVSSIMS